MGSADKATNPGTDFFKLLGLRMRTVAADGYCGVDSKGQMACGACSRSGEYFVYIGRVGTGYSEAKIRQLMPRLKAVAAVFSRGKLTDRKKAIRPEQSFLASVSTRDARSLGPLPRITDTQRARKSTSRRAVLARHFPRRQS